MAISLFTISNLAIAQITSNPYLIYNNKSCDVTIHYRVFDGNSCTQQCTGFYQVIAANSSLSIGCIGSSSDIEIVIIDMGGSSIVPNPFVNYGSGTGGGGNWPCYNMGLQTDSGSVPAASISACGPVWSIVVNATDAQIN